MTKWMNATVMTVLLWQAVANGQGRLDATGIKPLTPESYALALECPTMTGCEMQVLQDPCRNLTSFSATIVTPFSLAIAASREAARKFEDPPPMDLEAFNALQVQIVVEPSTLTAGGTIENVVIQREGQAVRPVAAKVEPKTYENAFGASRELAAGEFVFPFEVFEPSADLTIVLVGERGNEECRVRQAVLRAMK